MACNSYVYDAYFRFNYFLLKSIKPEIAFKGTKIIYYKINDVLNMKLLDRQHFLPAALAAIIQKLLFYF